MDYYPSKITSELYRDIGIELIPTDLELVPLQAMSRKEATWRNGMLTAMGDLLINAGVKLKIAAQAPHFFQETL